MSAGLTMSRWMLTLLMVCLGASAVYAAEESRRVEEQARQALDPKTLAIFEGERRVAFDYGIWINHLSTDYVNDDNDRSAPDATDATYSLDQRVWFRFTMRPDRDPESVVREHSLYLRLKDRHTWSDPSTVNGHHDEDGPHLDYLFVSLDQRPYYWQIGRRLYGVGQGLAYSNVGDGVELLASFPTWSVMGFAARSLPHASNADQSVPDSKNSGRTFVGVEGRYIGIVRHGLYAYAVAQRDDGDEDPEDPAQDYDYNSEYVGVGSEGTLIGRVRYVAEVMLETGTSFTSITNQEQDVRAWATDVSMTYDVQASTQPTLYAEYAFGSGDEDRSVVTDTIGGNVGGDDTNFLYFGYLPTGYALSPLLSNLHMVKIGAAFQPLERVSWLNLKELSISLDYYYFRKDEAAGGIFDFDATEADRDIGHEIDLTLAWRILSDLSISVEYGRFRPGEAYASSANDTSEYLAAGATMTF